MITPFSTQKIEIMSAGLPACLPVTGLADVLPAFANRCTFAPVEDPRWGMGRDPIWVRSAVAKLTTAVYGREDAAAMGRVQGQYRRTASQEPYHEPRP